jgi:excisionase family DNA binding protein
MICNSDDITEQCNCACALALRPVSSLIKEISDLRHEIAQLHSTNSTGRLQGEGGPFCSVEQAAATMGVDDKTLRNAIRAGEIPFAVRVGGRVLINVAGMLEWGRGKGGPALGEQS